MDNFSSETIEILNNLLATFFECNAKADNMSYALALDLKCGNASEFFHKNYAHIFPSNLFADKLSDIMTRYNIRPVRKSFEEHSEKYENIVILFKDNLDMMISLYKKIINTIEKLDYNDGLLNKGLIIELENILVDCSKWVNVAQVWAEKAEMYFQDSNIKQFDLDFSKFITLPTI